MKRTAIVLANMFVGVLQASAGTYSCTFFKDLSGVHACQVVPGTPCDYSFSKDLSASCFATDYAEPILDQLNCVFRTPTTNLDEFIKDSESVTLERFAELLARNPGYVSGAGTWTSPQVGALTVGYIEKTGAPTLQAMCTLKLD